MVKKICIWSARGLLVLLLALVLISSCASFDFRMKPAEADAFFSKQGVTATHHRYRVGDRDMHYVACGSKGGPLVLFVHGSPGSWDNFIHFLTSDRLLGRARLASVDRPGFGDSGYGTYEPSMAAQAAAIAAVLRAERGAGPAIVVGHSLGGPVAARMAMDFPELVDGLVLVAPSIDPDLEKTKWYQIPANWKAFSWIVPTTLKVTNREILPLKGELQAMLPGWADLHLPVTVIQGDKDRLVPPGNADFAARMLPPGNLELVRPADLNHFVPWNRPELIEAAILRQLDRLSPVPAEPPTL